MTNQIRKFAFGLLILSVLAIAPWSAYADPVTLTTGKVEGAAGKEIVVPISIKGVKAAKGVSCMSIRLSYDPEVLTFKSVDKGEVLPKSSLVDKSVDEKADPGLVGLGFACSSKSADNKEMASVDEDGVMLKAVFVVNDKAKTGQKSALKLNNYRLVDTAEPPFELEVRTEDGEFNVIDAGGIAALSNIPMLWIYIGIGIAAFLFLLLIVAALSRRRDPQPVQGYAPPAGAVVPRFTPEGATFNHTCLKCGGVIQLPGAMRGQTFQCGACGTTQIAGSSSK